MRLGMLVVIATLLTVFDRATALAQGSADPALEAYQLTMPNIRKMVAAYERLDSALEANPALARKLAADTGATSLADLMARLDREPVVRQAIAAAGITARDLVLTQLAMFVAGVTDVTVRAGAKTPTAPAAAANLRLYQQNRAEIEGMTARLKQLASWQALQAADESTDADEE